MEKRPTINQNSTNVSRSWKTKKGKKSYIERRSGDRTSKGKTGSVIRICTTVGREGWGDGHWGRCVLW